MGFDLPKTLRLPYPPSTNNLYATVRGRRVLSREGRAFKQAAATIAYAAGFRPVEHDVSVTVRVYRPAKRGDLDGKLKAVLDSLTGVAWNDDRQVTHIEAFRFEDKADPRVEIEIKAA